MARTNYKMVYINKPGRYGKPERFYFLKHLLKFIINVIKNTFLNLYCAHITVVLPHVMLGRVVTVFKTRKPRAGESKVEHGALGMRTQKYAKNPFLFWLF